jgi:hypothetical protein
LFAECVFIGFPLLFSRPHRSCPTAFASHAPPVPRSPSLRHADLVCRSSLLEMQRQAARKLTRVSRVLKHRGSVGAGSRAFPLYTMGWRHALCEAYLVIGVDGSRFECTGMSQYSAPLLLPSVRPPFPYIVSSSPTPPPILPRIYTHRADVLLIGPVSPFPEPWSERK